MTDTKRINVIGAGLAGCEAAYQASRLGVKVKLYEMKPNKMTPAHHSEGFAEQRWLSEAVVSVASMPAVIIPLVPSLSRR